MGFCKCDSPDVIVEFSTRILSISICISTTGTGDIPTGIKFAKEVNSTNLYKECAVLLEGIKHNLEAGQMYEKAENYEKAAYQNEISLR